MADVAQQQSDPTQNDDDNDDNVQSDPPVVQATDEKKSMTDVSNDPQPSNNDNDKDQNDQQNQSNQAVDDGNDADQKVDQKTDNNDDVNDDIDFKELDKILFNEDVGKNTNDLKWDDIKFKNDEEKEGAINLQNELKNNKKLTNLPPFEMARFYLGSKCRIPKASKKWTDTMDIYKTHKLHDVTETQMIKCFKEMSKCIRFGGIDNDGKAIFAMKYSLWLPKNYESTDIIMKCFLLILNKFTENLDTSRNGVIFIADCKNMGWVNFNIDMEKIFTKLMQDAYPLRVGKMYMVDAPFLLNILIKICKPFLSKKMQERIIITNKDDMLKEVPKDQIPIFCGGTYDDTKSNPMYQGCIRYMRRCNIDHFKST